MYRASGFLRNRFSAESWARDAPTTNRARSPARRRIVRTAARTRETGMIAGLYANCGHRDRDQTREAACLPKSRLGIKPRRLFAHDRSRTSSATPRRTPELLQARSVIDRSSSLADRWARTRNR